MNAIPEFKPENFVNPHLLKLAEAILEGVRAGQIIGVGAILVNQNGVQTQSVGAPFPLYFGADMLKDDLKKSLMGQPGQNGKIMRPM